jgi:hypothetical protein
MLNAQSVTLILYIVWLWVADNEFWKFCLVKCAIVSYTAIDYCIATPPLPSRAILRWKRSRAPYDKIDNLGLGGIYFSLVPIAFLSRNWFIIFVPPLLLSQMVHYIDLAVDGDVISIEARFSTVTEWVGKSKHDWNTINTFNTCLLQQEMTLLAVHYFTCPVLKKGFTTTAAPSA